MRMNQHPRLFAFIKRHRLHVVCRLAFCATRIAQHTDAKIRRLCNRQICPLRAAFLKVCVIRVMSLQRLRIIHHRLMRLAKPRVFHIIVVKRISHHRQNGDDGYRNQQFNQSKPFCFHFIASLRSHPHQATQSDRWLLKKFHKDPRHHLCSEQKQEQKNRRTEPAD